ncbi:hypothetical protein RSAG8_13138, partial [Rhizoctonia solani AG-8 WAC10335]
MVIRDGRLERTSAILASFTRHWFQYVTDATPTSCHFYTSTPPMLNRRVGSVAPKTSVGCNSTALWSRNIDVGPCGRFDL